MDSNSELNRTASDAALVANSRV